jgi:phosphotransferase system enzyme I (PtsP)
LRQVADAGHAEGKHVSICGELAGDPLAAVLLLAMGYDMLSMNATNLPKVKSVIRKIKLHDAKELLDRVMQMDSALQIRDFLEEELTAAGVIHLRAPPASAYKS